MSFLRSSPRIAHDPPRIVGGGSSEMLGHHPVDTVTSLLALVVQDIRARPLELDPRL